MSSLGQSSIEYVTTYGWMVLAVSLAGASLYPALDRGCQVQISDSAAAGDIAVEQAGVTENGSFQAVLDSQTDEEILIESLQLRGSDDGFEVVRPQVLAPGSELVFDVGEVERTGSCQDYTMDIVFDKGPLKNQEISLGIQGSLNLIEGFVSLIEITGDSVSEIDVETSIHPSEEVMCIGSGCTETTGTEVEGDEYVNYSGDEMTGTLRTSDIESKCMGNNCPVREGTQAGYANTNDSKIDGTLNVTEIMPVSREDPVIDIR